MSPGHRARNPPELKEPEAQTGGENPKRGRGRSAFGLCHWPAHCTLWASISSAKPGDDGMRICERPRSSTLGPGPRLVGFLARDSRGLLLVTIHPKHNGSRNNCVLFLTILGAGACLLYWFHTGSLGSGGCPQLQGPLGWKVQGGLSTVSAGWCWLSVRRLHSPPLPG